MLAKTALRIFFNYHTRICRNQTVRMRKKR